MMRGEERKLGVEVGRWERRGGLEVLRRWEDRRLLD